MMDQDQIDAALPKWKKDIEAAQKNLADLEASPGYKLTRQFLPKMQGKSASKVATAFKDFDAIWVHFSLVKDVVKRAEELRANMPTFFGKADIIEKIDELLRGQSIILSTTEVPLAERSLTGATQKQERTTPKDIFSKMQTVFEAVAKASDLYEKSYVDLTDRLGKALEEVEKSGDVEKRAKLDTICALIDSDPITGLEQFEAASKPPKKLVRRLNNGQFAPLDPPKPSVETKRVEPEKTIGPAPQEQPKTAPTEVPSPDLTRMLDDSRVKRPVGTEKLDDLQKLILTKKRPVTTPAPSPSITLPKSTPSPPKTPEKTLEDLIKQRKKGKL